MGRDRDHVARERQALSVGAPPPVLDADQVAELLHLGSGREAVKLARRRVLPHVRLGPKRILFLLDSVLAALKRREVADFTDGELKGQE